MIDCGKAPSRQTELPITEGYELVEEVSNWVRDNPIEWKRYISICLQEGAYGILSPNYVKEILRHRHRVSIRNSYAPVLARMAAELYPDKIRFRLARSKVDGFFDSRSER